MKKWILIACILSGLCLIGGSIAFFVTQSGDNEPVPTPSPSSSPNEEDTPSDEEIIDYYALMDYVCTKPEVEETLDSTNYTYVYQKKYNFLVQDSIIITGEVSDNFQFDSEDAYHAFLEATDNKETNFTRQTDDKNLKIVDRLHVIFYPEEVSDNYAFDEQYLTFLTEQGYSCILQESEEHAE